MKKREIIIFTIIFSIISIVIILLSYFGIIRYLQIRNKNNSDNYIENYNKLEKHEGVKGKVIISVSTTPERIYKIRPMVNSILDQTVKVDELFLIIYQKNNYDIPPYLKNVFRIFPFSKDYGKANKIIPLLFKEKESDTTIIGLDDNVIYGKDFIQILLEERDKNPDTVLIDTKRTTILIKPEYYGCDILKRDRDNYDEKWLLDNTNNSKIINYTENYTF